MAKINEIDITSLLWQEGAAPSTPASTKWRLYFKTDGLYFKDDAGTETGPLVAAGATTFVGARVYNNANVSITTSGVSQNVTFNSERFDTDAFHDTGSNTDRLVVPTGKGGKYLITGHLQYAANATGIRSIGINLNGTTNLAQHNQNANASGTTIMSVSTVYELSAGDYVVLVAFQSSGGALNVELSANRSPEFTISKL